MEQLGITVGGAIPNMKQFRLGEDKLYPLDPNPTDPFNLFMKA